MAKVVSAPHALPRWAVTIANGAMCGSAAIFLGGGPIVVFIAFLAGAAIHRVQLLLSRLRLPGFYVQVAGGFVASAFAVAVKATGVGVDPSLVITSNIIMLLAGIGLMGALQDALTGFYVTATARILEAVLYTAGIIAGVSGGLGIAAMLGIEVGYVEPGRAGWEGIPLLALGAALCAAAFAVCVYSPWRVVIPVAVIALAAAVLDRVISNLALARPWGAAAAALLIGLVAYSVAGRVKVPPLVIIVPAITPLLPGLAIYRGLSLVMQGTQASTADGLLALMTAAAVATALASGVILGEWIAQPLKREARRLETRLAGPASSARSVRGAAASSGDGERRRQ
ncbi:threonine/serine exporter family protein [Tessaracoccus coleopterorum]|uniref:threonine/serine ThrE exporter family protein n=1 Tax=Tessaracoccus coleopterorum TaxID=2714950 RepID=UPI0022B22931|nr:threonine/serine exporter family protein [Tessaracoccus coleopterorum]